MVFATSDSCNTLVSLDNGVKRLVGKDIQSSSLQELSYEYARTNILLPSDDYDYGEDGDECDSRRFGPCIEQNLYLPDSSPVDVYLRTVPEVMESADVLLANPPRNFSGESRERLLYVDQGEVGHAVESQCDVIVSDKATTCHILAFRSTRASNSCLPLVSLAHVDSAAYEDCIRGMVQEHKAHHFACHDEEDSVEEKKEEAGSDMSRIEMDIHLVGGFEDTDESSREISNHLMNVLSSLAYEEQSFVRMTLRTCAVTSMNDTGHCSPIARGLGIEIHSGEAFLAEVDRAVAGPSKELRSVRLWAGGRDKKLCVIHSASSKNTLSVQPFSYEPFKEIDVLLRLPDHVMLQYTSTSPDVEEADFCDNIRKTLLFMRSNKCCDVFGNQCDTRVTYCRVGTSNKWKLVRKH